MIFGSEDANVYCLDAAGKQVWKCNLEDQVRCPATISGNRGYFAACSALISMSSTSIRGTRWPRYPSRGRPAAPAALYKDRAYVGTEDSQFLGIDLAKGAVVWRFQDPAQPFRSSAAVADEGVYVGCRDKKLHAFDPQSGRPLWEFATRGMVDSSPVVVGSRLFFGSSDGRVYGLDRHTGKEVWRYDAGGKIYASPAVAAGRLVIGSDAGKLYCFK